MRNVSGFKCIVVFCLLFLFKTAVAGIGNDDKKAAEKQQPSENYKALSGGSTVSEGNFYIKPQIGYRVIQLQTYGYFIEADENGAVFRKQFESYNGREAHAGFGLTIGHKFELSSGNFLVLEGATNFLINNSGGSEQQFSGESGITRVGWYNIDGNGTVLFQNGDPIRTAVKSQFTYSDAVIRLKYQLDVGNNWTAAPFFGVNAVFFDQTYDVSAFEIPTPVNKTALTEEVKTQSYGTGFGVELGKRFDSNWSLTAEIEGTYYWLVNGDYSGNQTQEIEIQNILLSDSFTAQSGFRNAGFGGRGQVELNYHIGQVAIGADLALQGWSSTPVIVRSEEPFSSVPAGLATNDAWSFQSGVHAYFSF